MIERLSTQKIGIHRDPNLIGLFPGSRAREIRKMFPVMIETGRRLLQSNSTLRFQVAAASEELAYEMSEMLTAETLADRRAIGITVGKTGSIMQRAFVGIVASGSATLEAAYFGMPFVLIYKVAWPTYLAARLVVTDAIVNAVRLLVENSTARDEMISNFGAIINKLGGTGASDRAACAILDELKEGRSPDRPAF
jgi:lipid-A-disaccharide synthase